MLLARVLNSVVHALLLLLCALCTCSVGEMTLIAKAVLNDQTLKARRMESKRHRQQLKVGAAPLEPPRQPVRRLSSTKQIA